MNSFVSSHKQDWNELERLVQRARKWLTPLSATERDRLDTLYRRTAVHLARVSTRTADEQLISYLNNLTAAAHSVIYLPPRESVIKQIGRFIKQDFAQAIARNGPAHLLSATLVLCGALIGYAAATMDPVLAHALWPATDARQPGSTHDQLMEHLRYGRDESQGYKFLFASFLFQHNLKVGLLAMATGVLAAVPTVFFMLFNGMLLGVFAAIHYQVGIREEMWAWILPHGVTEIGAIILCGGVGFMLGHAVVRPGLKSRRQSLIDAGREAAQICVGAAGMLVLAAIIESYVRQSHWSTASRLIFAGSTAVFWAAYIANGVALDRRERSAIAAERKPMSL